MTQEVLAGPAGVILAPAHHVLRALGLPAKLAALGMAFIAGAGSLAAGLAQSGPFAGWLVAAGVAGLALWAWLALAFCIGFIGGLNRLVGQMDEVAKGRLLPMTPPRGRDEIAQLGRALAGMVKGLSAVVCEVRSSAALVEEAGQRLAGQCGALSGRTERQAASLQQTSAGLRQLAATVQSNAANAVEADGDSSRVRGVAEKGSQAMEQALRTIAAIQEHSRQMVDMVAVIDQIAFQTNVLALNASVEAARAGGEGRGFAVVAGEVRRLANRCAEEAARIRTLIDASTANVEQGVKGIAAAGSGMTQVVDGVRQVAGRMSSISSASREQSEGVAQLAQAVEQMDAITRENASMVEEASRQSAALRNRSASLSGAVAHFSLPQGTAGEALALVNRARDAAAGRNESDWTRNVTDPRQPFHDRDMYVFALDATGCYRAFGGNPSKVGTRVQDLPGVRGAELLAAIRGQAEREPGWVEYEIQNPATGLVQSKMSYVLKLGSLYLGCGVYQKLAAA